MNHSDMHRLSTQQHVSLDKHQRMIDDALKWQRLSGAADKGQQPVAARRLQATWAALVNLLIGR